MSRVDVSVLMVAYDAERFIGEALASVHAQTVVPAQIVVVDDGSTDATAEIVAADPSVTLLRTANFGAAPARNAGLELCDQPVIALLDADDLWLPTKLERQLAVLERGDVDAVFCQVDEFVDSGFKVEGSGVRQPKLGVDAVIPSAAMVRRPVFERIGTFSGAEISVGDWIEWWSRARAAGVHEVVVPEVLLRRRLHGKNNSHVRAGDLSSVLLRTVREHRRASDHG